jgi:hypothetical protein
LGNAPTAKSPVQVAYKFFFLWRPISFFDTVSQIVFPPLSTLFGGSIQPGPDRGKRPDGDLAVVDDTTTSVRVVVPADIQITVPHVRTKLFIFLYCARVCNKEKDRFFEKVGGSVTLGISPWILGCLPRGSTVVRSAGVVSTTTFAFVGPQQRQQRLVV